jgi:hypothetical protein
VKNCLPAIIFAYNFVVESEKGTATPCRGGNKRGNHFGPLLVQEDIPSPVRTSFAFPANREVVPRDKNIVQTLKLMKESAFDRTKNKSEAR